MRRSERPAAGAAWAPMALAVWASALPGCVAPERQGPSFATGFDVPETDGVLLEWRECPAEHPCITGDVNGKPYRLGFAGSPSALDGHVGSKQLRLRVEPDSIFRLGDHAIDMTFTDDRHRAVLTLTWNEREQVLIDSRMVVSDGD